MRKIYKDGGAEDLAVAARRHERLVAAYEILLGWWIEMEAKANGET